MSGLSNIPFSASVPTSEDVTSMLGAYASSVEFTGLQGLITAMQSAVTVLQSGKASAADVLTLQGQMSVTETNYSALQVEINTNATNVITLQSFQTSASATLLGLQTLESANAAAILALQTGVGILPLGTAATHAATDFVLTLDVRLSNARTPTTHASTHGINGIDVITPASIGAASVASLAPVATSGKYTDLTSHPTIPAAPVSASLSTSGVFFFLLYIICFVFFGGVGG